MMTASHGSGAIHGSGLSALSDAQPGSQTPARTEPHEQSQAAVSLSSQVSSLSQASAPASPGSPASSSPSRSGFFWTYRSLRDMENELGSCRRLNILLSLVTLVSVTAASLCFFLQPGPVYFGMSEDMKLLPMTPLEKPVMTDAGLKSWVSVAVTDAFNLDYLNFREQLNRSRANFTRKAFTDFAVSLDKEGHLPLLRQQRALMHSVVQGTPILTRSGTVQGCLVWEFEIPLLVSYETSRGRISSNEVTVVCQVRRVPVTDYPAGVAVSSLVTMQKKRRN